MDMTLNQAADEVRKMLRGFKAVEQVSAALEAVGSIQNAGVEGEKQLAAVKAEIQKANDDLAIAKADIANAKEESKKISSDAKAKADARIKKADDESAKIVSDANEVKEAAQGVIEASKGVLATINAECDSSKKKLAELERSIFEARETVAKLLRQ